MAASPESVWQVLTTGIGDWWPHSFTDDPFRIALEPTIGGRFYEQFDESGAGALYAHVTYLEPGRGGTTVPTSASLVGALSAETVETYRTGGEEILKALRTHVEAAPVIAG